MTGDSTVPVPQSQPQPEPQPEPQDGTGPWDRFGWLMGSVWVGFLLFPLGSAVRADTDPVWRAAGVAVILAFGTVYLLGLWRTTRMQHWDHIARAGWRHLLPMVVLQVASAAVIGVEAIYLLPFVISFASFTLPVRAAVAVSSAGVATVVLVPWLAGDLREHLFFVPIVILVAVFAGLIRFANERQAQHQALAEDLALVAERERVARDVHDVLGHSLTVVSVKAELAERMIDVDPERARAELVAIQSLTREALAEIRATVTGLRVARLGDELAAARTALSGAGIEADLPDDPSLVDPRHRIVVAWVLREAITNVVRHSGATRCTVELGPDLLRVTDDGRGRGSLREGNGLRGIRERVTAAGATLSLLPGPGPEGQGTTVEVRL